MAERVRAESRTSSHARQSRPGSALSTTSTSNTAAARQTTARPPSTLAYAHQQPPNHPKTPKPSAARYGGLAEKELQKVSASSFPKSVCFLLTDPAAVLALYSSRAVFELQPRRALGSMHG